MAWIVHVPAATSVTVDPATVQTPGVVEAKLTAKPEEAVALTAKGAVPKDWFTREPKLIVWIVNPFCVTAIGWPSTVRVAVRVEVDVLAVNEKLMTPLLMLPMVSQAWSLVGAKIPARDVVEGSTGSSASDPAETGSVKLVGPTKA